MGTTQSGALNTKGFSSQIKNNQIPPSDSITYSGIFNQINYNVGPKTEKLIDIIVQQTDLAKGDQFIGIFTKSSKDGAKRDITPIHAVILLDISGSMQGGLTRSSKEPRLGLAKTAIMLFLDKLRNDDAFSLVVFNNIGKTILPLTLIQNIDKQQFYKELDEIKAGGGTTILPGFQEAVNNLHSCHNSLNIEKVEKRIIMMTDVGDNSVQGITNFIDNLTQSQIHTTIIGISDDFVSSTCEQLINVKGFNYFCAIEDTDLIKFLVDNFDFTFFPFAYEMEIVLESKEIVDIEVFGTSDALIRDSYKTQELTEQNRIVVTRSKSVFPSAINFDEQGRISMEGGLILCKVQSQSQTISITGKIDLNYKDSHGNCFCEQYDLEQSQNDIEIKNSINDGVQGFYYVQTMKQIINDMNSQEKKLSDENKQMYINKLNEMKKQCPAICIEQVENMIKMMANK